MADSLDRNNNNLLLGVLLGAAVVAPWAYSLISITITSPGSPW